jgi:hypothetical protein
MPPSRQRRLALALLLSLSLLGCTGEPGGLDPAGQQADGANPASDPAPGSDAAPGAGAPAAGAPSGNPNQQSNQAAPGAPGGQGTAKAIGSPFKIPAIEQYGAPVGEVFGSIQDIFEEKCGGSLCVELVVEPSDADPQTCLVSRLDPPTGTTVRISAQTKPRVAIVCTPIEDPGTGDPPPEETQPPPDDTQPPPEDTQPPPEDTQPPPSSS